MKRCRETEGKRLRERERTGTARVQHELCVKAEVFIHRILVYLYTILLFFSYVMFPFPVLAVSLFGHVTCFFCLPSRVLALYLPYLPIFSPHCPFFSLISITISFILQCSALPLLRYRLPLLHWNPSPLSTFSPFLLCSPS